MFWQYSESTADLGELFPAFCNNCNRETPRYGILKYRYWHVLYLIGMIGEADPLQACTVCKTTYALDPNSLSFDYKERIPILRRYGCAALLVLATIAAIMLFLVNNFL
jgi:hypothetical protein